MTTKRAPKKKDRIYTIIVMTIAQRSLRRSSTASSNSSTKQELGMIRAVEVRRLMREMETKRKTYLIPK